MVKKSAKFARISDYFGGVSDFTLAHLAEKDAADLFATNREAHQKVWDKYEGPSIWILHKTSMKRGTGYMLFLDVAYGRYRLVVWEGGTAISDTSLSSRGGMSNCGNWFVATEFYGEMAGMFKRTSDIWE